MGYVLTKFDDARLCNSPFGLECRGANYRIYTEEGSLEIDSGKLDLLIAAIEVLRDKHADTLRPPGQKLANRWRLEDAIEQEIEDISTAQARELTPDDLRRYANYLESPP